MFSRWISSYLTGQGKLSQSGEGERSGEGESDLAKTAPMVEEWARGRWKGSEAGSGEGRSGRSAGGTRRGGHDHRRDKP